MSQYKISFFFLSILKKYLFIFGSVGSLLLHRLSLVGESRGYSLIVVLGLLIARTSFIAEHGLSCCDLYVGSGVSVPRLYSPGSVTVAHRLSCSAACGILVPHPGIKFVSPADQIRSVTQSCPTLCDPMNRSTPGLPVHHQIPELTHVHRVGDAIQPSHPLSSPCPPAPNPSQHQSLFQ